MSAEKSDKRNPKKRGLGRGLNALFEDEEATFENDEYAAPDDDMQAIEKYMPGASRKILGVGELYPCPTQPRRYFDEKAIRDLADSISVHGLLQPIVVRPDKNDPSIYEIIAGERRWRAAQKAGLHEVPVVIKDLDDASAFQISLVENLQRQDLNPMEEAEGYQRLIDDFGHSPDSVGEVLGKSRSHVANMIRLVQLPRSVQEKVATSQLSAGHARALLKSPDPEKMAEEVIAKKLSVRQTEKLVADYEGRDINHRDNDVKPKAKSGFSGKDADTLALENEVSQKLGMRVSIDMADQHAGKMSISFKTLDQLDDILQRLAQVPKG